MAANRRRGILQLGVLHLAPARLDVVERARQQDQDAVMELIAGCEKAIVGGILAAGVPRYSSHFDDARNTALFEIWKSFPTFNGDGAPCGWMRGIARRVSSSRVISPEIRERRRRERKPAGREILLLRLGEGLSEREVAELLIIAQGTAASRFSTLPSQSRSARHSPTAGVRMRSDEPDPLALERLFRDKAMLTLGDGSREELANRIAAKADPTGTRDTGAADAPIEDDDANLLGIAPLRVMRPGRPRGSWLLSVAASALLLVSLAACASPTNGAGTTDTIDTVDTAGPTETSIAGPDIDDSVTPPTNPHAVTLLSTVPQPTDFTMTVATDGCTTMVWSIPAIGVGPYTETSCRTDHTLSPRTNVTLNQSTTYTISATFTFADGVQVNQSWPVTTTPPATAADPVVSTAVATNGPDVTVTTTSDVCTTIIDAWFSSTDGGRADHTGFFPSPSCQTFRSYTFTRETDGLGNYRPYRINVTYALPDGSWSKTTVDNL